MKLLLYSRQDIPVIGKVREAVSDIGALTVEQSGSPENLEKAMETCFAGETLLVFVIHGLEDLGFLQDTQPGFMDIRILIYFACERGEMQDRAFQCYPRLICGPDGEEEILAAAARSILEKMAQALPPAR